jgi:MAF protein
MADGSDESRDLAALPTAIGTIPAKPVVILASTSPRRLELLTLLGLPFAVRPANVAETPLPGELPAETARRLAVAKASHVAAELRARSTASLSAGLVIGADTIVVDRGQVLGKPASSTAASSMLRQLRNRTHQVISAVAVVDVATGQTETGAETTSVRLRSLTDDEIAAYVASGDPLDKAGAYAIQSSVFHPVDGFVGCYSNVVGLPLCTVAGLLARFGVQVQGEWRTHQDGCRCARLAYT